MNIIEDPTQCRVVSSKVFLAAMGCGRTRLRLGALARALSAARVLRSKMDLQ